MNAFLFFIFCAKFLTYKFQKVKFTFNSFFVTLMANTGYSEECAYNINSWTLCDSYHFWLFHSIPLMHVC